MKMSFWNKKGKMFLVSCTINLLSVFVHQFGLIDIIFSNTA